MIISNLVLLTVYQILQQATLQTPNAMMNLMPLHYTYIET